MRALTATQLPYTGPYSTGGIGKQKGPTALALKRAMSRMGYLPWEPRKWDNAFNLKLEKALDAWDKGKDGYGRGRWEKLRAAQTKAGERALDAVAIKLIRDEHAATKAVVPSLGPMYHGGASVLLHDLTHATDGIPLFPAFDTAFEAGTGIIAPEPLTVIKESHSMPGDAFYALGRSAIVYWIAHLVSAPAVGRAFDREDLLGRVIRTSVGGGSHCHVALNVERLWGTGRQMLYGRTGRGPDYTHGSPTVGVQLRAHHDL